MCVILHFKPKFDVSFEKFSNAVLNNPDGWGLITIDRGKLEVRQGFSENGNDPDELYGILRDSRDTERFLHVRYATVGEKTKENCHPFKIMSGKDKPNVYFMHNGTIHKYRPGAGSTVSDSRNFAETFLSPLLYHFKGDDYDYNYHDPFFLTLLGDTFGFNNRGLLVSDLFEPLYLGRWESIKDGDDDHCFMASNDDYFKAVHTHRTHESRRAKQVFPSPSSSKGPVLVANSETTGNKEKAVLKDIDLRKIEQKQLTVNDFEKLISWGKKDMPLEEIDNEDLSYLQYIMPSELLSFVKSNPVGASQLMHFLFSRFAELYEEYDILDNARMKIVEKHEKATNLISSLTFEINELHKGGATTQVKAA